MAIDVIPALLVRSKRDLEAGLENLRGVSRFVQIDFVGGNYMEGEEGFPHWDEFDFEADLMVQNPLRDAEAMVALGAARIVVHADSPKAKKALQFLQDKRQGDFKVEVGLALRSHDAPSRLKEFEGLFDYVQVMGIDREGRQGEPPDPHHKDVELVRALRAAYPRLVLQVDGAVAPRIIELARAGADRLVVGSAIAGADNPKAVYKSLYNEANAER